MSLKADIRKLEGIKGSGTTLISLYVPGDRQLSQVAHRMDEEYAGAANIKSKQTRKSVQTAIDRTRQALRSIDRMPENGIAIFASDT